MNSQGVQDFLEWFRFVRLMEPKYCSNKLLKAEFSAGNIRVIGHMCGKHGAESELNMNSGATRCE